MSNSSQHDVTQLSDLIAFARQIAKEVQPGTVLALQGELGTGKTTFTQELLKSLGVTDNITSPTFALINQYQTKQYQRIFHLDLYRLKNQKEIQQLGLEELLLSPNIVIIEWPELASSLLPDRTWWLQFSLDETATRTVFLKKSDKNS